MTNATATITGLVSGETATVTAIGTITDAGFIDNTYEIAWGTAKADNYEITEKLGKLTVSKATVKIETGSSEKDYDGTALTNEAATITGLVSGETATVTATGTITDADTTDNTYEINWGTAKADNYEITEELGTLTVNPLQVTFYLCCPEAVDTRDSGTHLSGLKAIIRMVMMSGKGQSIIFMTATVGQWLYLVGSHSEAAHLSACMQMVVQTWAPTQSYLKLSSAKEKPRTMT